MYGRLDRTSIAIHANHMEMTKFGIDHSSGYVKILGELRRWMERWTSDKNKEMEQVRNSILVQRRSRQLRNQITNLEAMQEPAKEQNVYTPRKAPV